MSQKRHLPCAHTLGGVKVQSGYFFPDGANAVDNDRNVGSDVTVTRTGVGVFAVAFGTPYQNVLFPQADVVAPATGDHYKVEVTAMTVNPTSLATMTLKVFLQDPVSGVYAAADIADGDGIIAWRAEFLDQGAQLAMATEEKKAGGLLLALGLPVKKGRAKVEEEPADDDEDTDESHEVSEDEEEAAQALLDAIEAKDASGVATAMKALVMLCDDDSYED